MCQAGRREALDLLDSMSSVPAPASVLHRDMRACARSPDVVSLNTALHALGLAGELDAAMEMLKAAPRRLGVHPDTVSYNVLLRAMAKRGSWQQAVALIETMTEPDVVSYTSAIAACARAAADALDGEQAPPVRPALRPRRESPHHSTDRALWHQMP